MHNNNKVKTRFFPTIDIGDYILREQKIEDAENFFRYYSDPVVNKYIVSSIPTSIEETIMELKYWINVFDHNDGIYFAIANKNDNKMIGSIGVSGANRNHNRIEASYDLAEEYWGRGIMTRALKAVLKYSFEELKFNRIEAFAIAENVSSNKVLKKCGFLFEGNLRQHRFHNEKYIDIGIYSALRQEYLINQN
jgi:ribosomal-protein-alanine N-acetyltransferase